MLIVQLWLGSIVITRLWLRASQIRILFINNLGFGSLFFTFLIFLQIVLCKDTQQNLHIIFFARGSQHNQKELNECNKLCYKFFFRQVYLPVTLAVLTQIGVYFIKHFDFEFFSKYCQIAFYQDGTCSYT